MIDFYGFLDNPFVSQKKKDALLRLERQMRNVYSGRPENLEYILDELIFALLSNLPAILDTWAEKESDE